MFVSSQPLTGKALLNHLKDLSHLSKSDKAKACGYGYETKNGKTRTDMTAFLEAILAAEGLRVGAEATSGRGRTPTYRVTVHANGQIVIGKAYTDMMGLQPGDEFEIKLGYKHIQLIKLDPEESEESKELD